MPNEGDDRVDIRVGPNWTYKDYSRDPRFQQCEICHWIIGDWRLASFGRCRKCYYNYEPLEELDW